MTTTNRLCYTVSKRYIQAGTTFEINVKIKAGRVNRANMGKPI